MLADTVRTEGKMSNGFSDNRITPQKQQEQMIDVI